MVCFIVPMTLAMIIGAIRKKIPSSYHINWLIMLLGGGVISLVIDHIVNQEIVLTQTAIMINEIALLGSAMAIACVGIWITMVIYVSRMENIKSKTHQKHKTIE
jgi:hypothetical protein